jgi:diguanylate cyclase (GGDEF)-like protein
MKLSRSVWLGIMFLALMGVLGFLYYKTQVLDLDIQNQVVLDLRVLKQLDAEWNVNILKSRIGLNNDYDPVTAPLRHVRILQERLAVALKVTRGKAPRVVLDKFNMAFAEKSDLVDRFKSQNSILKNSLIYFPIAIENLKTLLHANAANIAAAQLRPGAQATQSQAVQATQVPYAIDAKISDLLASTLRFNLVPNQELGQKINLTLEQIASSGSAVSSRGYPVEVTDAMDQLARHARTILRQRVLEDNLVVSIAATPTEKYMDELITAFDDEFDSIANEKQRYRTYLLIYSGLLLILLGYAVQRVVKSYQVIARVNRRLSGANELLEQRVAERTAELEQQSARLAELATHDNLTGLINGGQLMSQLTRALLRAERRASIVVVMFIDLDGFKAINDTYGHATGDLVLKEVAQRVPRHLRQEDLLARLGGDEFVILLEEVSTREGAVRVAEEALNQLKQITSVGGHPVTLSGSIGISCAQGRLGVSYSAAALLDEADHAMYRAKQAGKGRICFSDNAQWTTSERIAVVVE